jgi:hypothetical protein
MRAELSNFLLSSRFGVDTGVLSILFGKTLAIDTDPLSFLILLNLQSSVGLTLFGNDDRHFCEKQR